MTEIKEIYGAYMPDTESIQDGYDRKNIPKATPDNIVVLVDKINELVREINKLKERMV